ncbi:MAG TPA: mechanosensitive ion channel family protein [Rhizomicrobium sp.]|nr:mechanosensitive ion channel family protein [Rhizomicrobium sp.]
MFESLSRRFDALPWHQIWAFGERAGAALAVAVVVFLALTHVHDRIAHWLRNAPASGHPAARIAAAVVSRTPRISIALGSLAFAIAAFSLLRGWMRPVFVMLLVVQVGLWLSAIFDSLMRYYATVKRADHKSFANANSLVRVLTETIVWSVVLIVVLSNFGINVSAMIAGLGIGGIAIGLAAQGIFADLFGSLAIVFDKPFVQGDFIVFGSESGTIEHVGIKSTRVRALSGEQIVLSNASLLAATIHNHQRLHERRVLLPFGVTYQTSHAKMRTIPDVVRRIVERVGDVRFERCHFKAFGDSALEFETVYYVQSPAYMRYMDVQQAINLEIMRRFAEMKIDFAYPSQTVFFGDPGAALGASSNGGGGRTAAAGPVHHSPPS